MKINQDKILPYYELGMPCVLRSSPGRIVEGLGELETLNGISYHTRVIFATPSGIEVEAGFFQLEEINGEELTRLIEQEQIVRNHGDIPYNGKH